MGARGPTPHVKGLAMMSARTTTALLAGTALLVTMRAATAQTHAPALPPGAADRAVSPGTVVPVQASGTAQRGRRPAAAEEITVTATRRASAISRVPLSISAFSQKTLDQKGARTIADVVRFTPGATFDPESNNISIRGIDSEAGAGTTGIYIDDTPVQIRNLGFNAENSLPELFDLDRVEVLRGPQGTLFGAGSEGGTVRYITPQPSLTKYSTYERATVAGSPYGGPSYDLGAALGGPIIKDVLGFRASASYDEEGGYLDHTNYQTGQITARNTNDSNVTVFRGALAWQPLGNLLVTPAVMYQQRLIGDTDAFFAGLSNRNADQFRTNAPERLNDTDRFYIPSLNVKYDLTGVSIISNTSYLHRDNTTGYEGTIYNLSFYNTYLHHTSPYFPLLLRTGINPLLPYYISPSRITNQQRNVTQEVRVQSNNSDARVVWVGGVFYSHNDQLSSEQIQDPLIDTLFPLLFGTTIEQSKFFDAPLYGIDSYINQTHAIDEQEAVFANATVRIVDGVKLDGGLRYAHTSFSFNNFAAGSQNGGLTTAAGGTAENPVTGKISLSWQINPRNLVYAGYGRGYRVGGANAPVPAAACAKDFKNFGITSTPETYGSDTVDSYEIGAKSRFLGNRLELSASIFKINWNNIQQNVLLPICSIQYAANLGSAVSQGFDLQATIRPVSNVTVDTGLDYDDAHFTTDAGVGTGLVAHAGDTLGDTTSGNAIPHWKFSVGAQYDVPSDVLRVGSGDGYIRGDYQFVGRPAGTSIQRDPLSLSYDEGYVRTGPTHFLSLRSGLVFGNGMNLSVFCNNVLNAAPRLTHEYETTGSRLFYNTTLRPRYVGLELTYRD